MNPNPTTFQDFLATQTPHVDMWEFLANLMLDLAVASLIAAAYSRWGRALSNRAAFARNLVLVSMTTMLIITIVKASLALSLGLVGALSIVRFRTPIKEPEELAFLFLSIAVGLGFGANQRIPVVVGVGLILLVIWAMRARERSDTPQAVHLTLSLQKSGDGFLERIVAVLERTAVSVNLRRHDERRDSFSSDFFVSFRGFAELDQARKELRALDEDLMISFLDNRLLA